MSLKNIGRGIPSSISCLASFFIHLQIHSSQSKSTFLRAHVRSQLLSYEPVGPFRALCTSRPGPDFTLIQANAPNHLYLYGNTVDSRRRHLRRFAVEARHVQQEAATINVRLDSRTPKTGTGRHLFHEFVPKDTESVHFARVYHVNYYAINAKSPMSEPKAFSTCSMGFTKVRPASAPANRSPTGRLDK